MKTHRQLPRLIFATVFCAASVQAQPGIRPLPTERPVVEVAPTENNPFVGKPQLKGEALAEEVETEESRLRRLLMKLPIGGIVKTGESCVVMMGPLTLREGDQLPGLLQGQTERVRVVKLNEREMVFGFIERDGTSATRTQPRTINLTPEVRFLIPENAPAANAPEPSNTLGGVIRSEPHAPAFR